MTIFKACYYGNIEFIKNYINLENNINITNEDNQTTLHLACYYENLEIVKLLISHGANIEAVNKWNNTPLQYLNDENKKVINALKYLKNN